MIKLKCYKLYYILKQNTIKQKNTQKSPKIPFKKKQKQTKNIFVMGCP